MIITLTGFMGVGKSTIASRLALYLYCRHKDLDLAIEEGEGATIDEIFSTRGEQEFRKLEEEYLEKLINGCCDKVFVLSLGGGALLSQKNRDLIKRRTFCIYLKASLETITERLVKAKKTRPLVKEKSDSELRLHIAQLFDQRKTGYESAADLTISVDNTNIRQILSEIMSSI